MLDVANGHTTRHRPSAGGVVVSWPDPAATPATGWPHRHLLDVDQLTRDELEECLDLAVEMRERRLRRETLDLLQGEVVGLAFCEPSTRTRVSFELAAEALGAQVVELPIDVSSVTKGESLVDTLRTLERTGVTTVILRHSMSGAPYLAARSVPIRIVNAGDGSHAHPTQALLDALTIRQRLGRLEGLRVLIAGDIAHSRVVRSNIWLLTRMGAKVVVCGPPTLLPPRIEEMGVEATTDFDAALSGADVVMMLRMQLERQGSALYPSTREYFLR